MAKLPSMNQLKHTERMLKQTIAKTNRKLRQAQKNEVLSREVFDLTLKLAEVGTLKFKRDNDH